MLEAQDLTARRGAAMLFTGVAFRVDAGRALLITGANGTGKTTLLRILAGLTMPEAGSVRWRGEAVEPFASALREDVVFIGHAPALKDELTAEENLRSLVELTATHPSDADMSAALTSVALDAQRKLPARVLSQGQRRRIGLARLQLSRRPLWLLDEPATALDAAGLGSLTQMIAQQLAIGGTVVAATHQTLDLPTERVATLALS
jgi:heme exporter protein A